jgi:hypothetical protein
LVAGDGIPKQLTHLLRVRDLARNRGSRKDIVRLRTSGRNGQEEADRRTC